MRSRDRVSARLAIEALRAGVPNSEAINRLGCPSDRIETCFETALDNAADADRNAGWLRLFDLTPRLPKETKT